MPAPDALNDDYFVAEDQLLVVPANGFLANDTDPDGDPLSIRLINGLPFSYGTPIALASGALLTVNADGSFQYDQNGRFTQLAAGQTFNEIFTYSISDDHFGTDTAGVCFTVIGLDPPVPPEPPVPPAPLTITGAVTGLVEEEQGLPGGIEDTTDANGLDTDENGLNTVSNVAVGTFSSFLSFTGNDGPLAYSFAPVVDGTPVLKTDGTPLTDPGAPVLFALSGGVLIGYVNVGAPGYVEGTDHKVFTVELNQPTAGQYTFTLLDRLDHQTADNIENFVGINLNNRVLVIDTGDPGDFEPIANFAINVIDDVPNAEIAAATAAPIVLDESALPPAGDGIVSATGNFSVNFAAAPFGADGPGSASYALVLTGSNVASGLFALDPADKSAGDGDGIGQGAQIVLNQAGNTITGSVGLTTYFTITLNPANGVVTFTDNTTNNLWHSNTGNPDDPQTLTLANANLLQLVQMVTDADGDSDAAAINLGSGVFTVQDDGPIAEPNIRTVPVGTLQTVDVQLIVDISGSMNDNVGPVPDFSDTRIGLARYALREFLEENTQIQNVEFVRFSSGANNTAWMTRENAINFLNDNSNWNANGTTNYDAALTQSMNAFGGPRPLPVSDDTFIYFVTDGVPNPVSAGIDNNGAGSNVSIAEWETFLQLPANDISEAFAIGVGPLGGTRSLNEPPDPLAAPTPVEALNPVSFPNTDADGNGAEDNVILVPDNDITPLLDTLNDAIGPPSSITGNVLVDDPSRTIGADAFGTDNGYIQSITVDGITYTFDGVGTITSSAPSAFINNGSSMTVPTAIGGTLTFFFATTAFNAAGDWSYLTGTSPGGIGTEHFPYVLVDGDGDHAPASLNIAVTSPLNRLAASDFDSGGTLGNGISDILFQSSDGTPAVWLMDPIAGTTFVGAIGPFNPGPSWEIKGTGDFNGDNKVDILWQSDDGTPAIWLMDGLNAISVGAIGPFNPGPGWEIKGTADFDGDQRSDILWQSSDGTPAIWFMDGMNVVSLSAVGPFNPGPSWEIKDTADFNGDGHADILWQNSDGTPAIWLMDGADAIAVGAVGPFNPGPSWEIKGTGDFNGDGKADILWQNSDGTPAIWLMDGMNTLSVGAVGGFNPGLSWQVQGTGDLNGDGRSDILWQNSDGTPAVWFMNGMNIISGVAAGAFNPGPDWHIIA